MFKIYQQFNLNLEELTNILDKTPEKIKKNFSAYKAAKKLKGELLKKGYDILVLNEVFCGVPKSIILGGTFGMKHKDDFYELAQKLNLPFSSGPFYRTD